MADTINVKNLIINKVESQEVFEYMIANGFVNENELYLIQGTRIASIAEGGTGRTTIADTEYAVIKYRGSALVSSETDPTENGTICWTYE